MRVQEGPSSYLDRKKRNGGKSPEQPKGGDKKSNVEDGLPSERWKKKKTPNWKTRRKKKKRRVRSSQMWWQEKIRKHLSWILRETTIPFHKKPETVLLWSIRLRQRGEIRKNRKGNRSSFPNGVNQKKTTTKKGQKEHRGKKVKSRARRGALSDEDSWLNLKVRFSDSKDPNSRRTFWKGNSRRVWTQRRGLLDY